MDIADYYKKSAGCAGGENRELFSDRIKTDEKKT